MNYEKELRAYAVKVLEKIVSGDKDYGESDLQDCMTVLFGK